LEEDIEAKNGKVMVYLPHDLKVSASIPP
jgi:hypothetical protein